MKIVFGLVGSVVVAAVVALFLGLVISYSLIFVNFAGPDSIVEKCFEVGFSIGLVGGLTVGFFMARYFFLQFWREYSSSEDD